MPPSPLSPLFPRTTIFFYPIRSTRSNIYLPYVLVFSVPLLFFCSTRGIDLVGGTTRWPGLAAFCALEPSQAFLAVRAERSPFSCFLAVNST